MDGQEFINRIRAAAYGRSEPDPLGPARNRHSRPRLELGSRTRSTVGQVAPMLPLEAPPSRAQQRAEYDAAQRSATRPRAAPAYQPPSNQFAEAGQFALEATGLPSVRRSARAFASGDMQTGVEEGAMGALGVGTLLAGGRGARAPRPIRPDLGANDRGALQRGGAILRGDEFVDSAAGQGPIAPRNVEEALAYSDKNPLPTRGAFAAPAYVRSMVRYISRGDWEAYSRVVDSVNEQGPLATVQVARILAEIDPRWANRAADFDSVNDLMRAQDFLNWVRRSNDPWFAARAERLQREARRDQRARNDNDDPQPPRGPSQ